MVIKSRYLLLLFILVIGFVSAQVSIKDFVNDYAEILNSTEEQEIASIARAIYDSGEAEYSVVTIKSLDGRDIESYSIELAQGKLGSREKNNGLLLLVAVDDHQYRFEVGKGIEGILNDAKAGRVGRDYIVPYFKQEKYGQGILETSKAIRGILLNESDYVEDENNANLNLSLIDTWTMISLIIPAIMLILFIITIIRALKNRKKYFKAARNATILFGGFGRGGTGGFSRGGFGGFGGGGFSGGGASGGW